MAPLSLEGETLGEKHRNYNKLLRDALTKTDIQISPIDYKHDDLDNLLKIDIACNIKNGKYIIDVLKSKDMLYISKAIKQSTWLITDSQYAHIINPEYLHNQLLPLMSSKAISKFMLHIRLHLKDEKRVEAFYDYLKDKTDESYKWLENCSEPFIIDVLQGERRIPMNLFQRLCRRSFTFAKYYSKVNQSHGNVFNSIIFLLKSHTEEFLKLVISSEDCIPYFNEKSTSIIMKKCPNIILDNFEIYAHHVDAAVVAKHLKKNEVKEFLLKNVMIDSLKHYFNSYHNLNHFVKNMPKEERFQFVKKMFINKTEDAPTQPSSDAPADEMSLCYESVTITNQQKCRFDNCNVDYYQWYKYVPFNTAFADLKKIVRTENMPADRADILSVLITCAAKSSKYMKSLLQFYNDKHINEPLKFKLQFVNNLLNKVPTHKFDAETWNLLNQLFHSMEVYTQTDNYYTQTCVESIFLYKVLKDEKVPEIIETKMKFNTFQTVKDKLNKDEKNKLFVYLWNNIMRELQEININDDKKQFKRVVALLVNALQLLGDWNKPLIDYPLILHKINELVLIKKKNLWNIDLSSLYTINKSGRKDMFSYSLSLNPSEKVCLNALKHDPQLLIRHNEEIATLQSDDSVSLRRLLGKLRIYWSHSIAQEWTKAYTDNLIKPTGQKSAVRGLFTLLTPEQLVEIVKEHAPEDDKIKWSEVDPIELSLRKNIAKSFYLSRPHPSLDAVLLYAKGDYLQFTVPSLNAILHNLSKTKSREIVSKLLEAPVSLQKYGLHLVFNKFNDKEQKEIFSTVWKTTKNSSIRYILFSQTYRIMSNSDDSEVRREMWGLLSMFIDNLNAEENKKIYTLLSKVPDKNAYNPDIQAEFYMKSYIFLSSLPAKVNREFINDLINFAPKIMASLNSEFVTNTLLKSINEQFSNANDKIISIISSYLLYGTTEEEQLLRYNTIMAQVIDHALQSWDEIRDQDYQYRKNIKSLLSQLSFDFKALSLFKKIVYPRKLFKEIQSQMEQKLCLKRNYVLYTSWKLTTEYVKLAEEHKHVFNNTSLDKLSESDYGYHWVSSKANNIWKELHLKVVPALGAFIDQCLKDDVRSHFHTVYILFSEALTDFFDSLRIEEKSWILETMKYVLNDNDFIPSHLVACMQIPSYIDEETKPLELELFKIISTHPSDEVKMHFYKIFGHRIEIKSFIKCF